MSKKNRLGFDILINKPAIREDVNGIRLSILRYVDISELRENPINVEIFKQESEEYFKRLEEDIKERGVLVPLIATQEGYLLSGHNRLKVALKLGLRTVPVQYVEDRLTQEQERSFLIKDNLYRRHLNQAEWVKIYEKLYPNFREWAEKERRGRKKKDMSFFSNETELSAEKIANDTGQSVDAVKKQLVRMKREKIESEVSKNQTNISIRNVLRNASISEASVHFNLQFLKTQKIDSKISKSKKNGDRGEIVVSLKDLIEILEEK